MRNRRLLARLSGGAHQNVAFDDMQRLVEAFGFRLLRISGSHYVYSHPALDQLLNLQSAGGEAKAYQIRQFLRLVERYNLTLEG